MVLSPSCAAAVTRVAQANAEYLVDGGRGGACYWEASCAPVYGSNNYSPASTGRDFCSAIAGCVGGADSCEDAICGACDADDADSLDMDGGYLCRGGWLIRPFFYGLCPPVDPSNPCADLACLVDAGPRVLSPSCAAALASLAGRYLDGGVDGG
jgi:hypothetical protein